MNFSLKKFIQNLIFSSKWLLIPFYLKLFWTLTKLMYHFFVQGELSNDDLISTLQDVDIVMIANLVKSIITGSYNSFVDKTHGVEGESVSSGALKVKMGASIVGISSIHLLQTFISANSKNISLQTLHIQVLLHLIFIIGVIALAVVDYLHCKTVHP